MGRPHKSTIPYFSHDSDASESRTVTILENHFRLEGYAIWFKLLERVSASNNQVIDYSNPITAEFLAGKLRISPEKLTAILDKLAELEAIDQQLWAEHRIIWCQKLVDRLGDVYKRRQQGPPQKPSLNLVSVNSNAVIADGNAISANNMSAETRKNDTETPQSKVKESKVKESKGPSIIPQKGDGARGFQEFWDAYPRKRSRGQAETAFEKAVKKAASGGVLPGDFLILVLSAVEAAKHGSDWQKDGGVFIPYPATWLSARGWEDEKEDKNEPRKDKRKPASRFPDRYPTPGELRGEV